MRRNRRNPIAKLIAEGAVSLLLFFTLAAYHCLAAPPPQITAEWLPQSNNLWADNLSGLGLESNWTSGPGVYPGLSENNDIAVFDGLDVTAGTATPNVTLNTSLTLQGLYFTNANATES